MNDVYYMKEAIKQAKKAENIDDVPVGCVIVCDGKIIARGYNRRTVNQQTDTRNRTYRTGKEDQLG